MASPPTVLVALGPVGKRAIRRGFIDIADVASQFRVYSTQHDVPGGGGPAKKSASRGGFFGRLIGGDGARGDGTIPELQKPLTNIVSIEKPRLPPVETVPPRPEEKRAPTPTSVRDGPPTADGSSTCHIGLVSGQL